MELQEQRRLEAIQMMDEKECYEWARIFDSDWSSLVNEMGHRATAMQLTQEVSNSILVWRNDKAKVCRWVFVEDPSDIQVIRAVFNDDDNVRSPSCFVVVKQNDPSDDRGDVIFDIFRLNPDSYLWHFYRVYTPPKT